MRLNQRGTRFGLQFQTMTYSPFNGDDQTLRVPPGRPHRFVFPVVWSTLYIGIISASGPRPMSNTSKRVQLWDMPAISLSRRWTDPWFPQCVFLCDLLMRLQESELHYSSSAAANHTGVKLYWAQLGLNFLWTPLFFGLRRVRGIQYSLGAYFNSPPRA